MFIPYERKKKTFVAIYERLERDTVQTSVTPKACGNDQMSECPIIIDWQRNNAIYRVNAVKEINLHLNVNGNQANY